MNIFLVIVLLISTAIYINYELNRRQRIRRRFRDPCSYCGSEDVERRHLRVAMPKDDLNPNLVNQGDMLCQTQKKCRDKNCTSHQLPNFSPSGKTEVVKEGRWREEKTTIKHFGWWHRTFRPNDCCPNAIPDELIGPWRLKLLRESVLKEKATEVKHYKFVPKRIQ